MIGTALVIAAIALPWLILLPLHGAAAMIAHAATLVAAFHGAGLVVGRLAHQRTAAPLLVVQWGIAALIGISGLAIAVHAGTLATHAVLVFGFAAVHTGSLGMRFAQSADRIEASVAQSQTWVVPVALLAGLGALAIVGAAGDTLVQPFDDEGHVLAQLKRLLDTGQLADSIGYPRRAQLGGQIALAAVLAGAGDGVTRIGESLAAVLALGLAVSRIRARDTSSALWASLLVVSAFALALAPFDPTPCWMAVGLVVALYAMLTDTEPVPALPLALTAGALVALRYELAPIAAIAMIVRWWPRRTDHRTTAVLLGGVLAVTVPLLIARTLAWRAVPALAHAALAGPPQAAIAARIAIAAAIAIPASFVLRIALPENPTLRGVATATAAALGALVAHLTGPGAYSLRLAWPIAIAFAITVVIELARSRWSGPGALIGSLVLCLLLYEGREAPGRLRWSRRMAAAATSLEALQRPPSSGAERYAALLAITPPGATVAGWVNEPERLDYGRHRIVDLRTPAGARLRSHRWADHASAFEPLLAQLGASYLLIEADDAAAQRTRTDLLYRFVCQTPLPICADDLEAIALHHRTAGQIDNLRLVDLHP